MTTKQLGRWLAPLVILVLIAAGCGGDDDDGGGDSAGDTTTTAAADDTTTTTAAGATLTVTPDTGLAGGDTVTLEAAGFSPNAALGITQCVDEEDPDNGVETTTAAECDLQAIAPVEADADGNASAEFAVNAGPFGEAQVVCDPEHDCVLSLGELSADPDAERAVAKLLFA